MLSKDGFFKPAVPLFLISAIAASGCNGNDPTLAVPVQAAISGCSLTMATNRVIVKVRQPASNNAPDASTEETSSSSVLAAAGAGMESQSSAMAVQAMFASTTGAANHAMDQIARDTFSVELLPGETSTDIIQRLKGDSQLEYAEPDYIVSGNSTLNDPDNSKVWAIPKIQSDLAWDLGQGSKKVIVAIVDSGIDPNHPDLQGNLWHNPRETAGNGRDDDGNGLVDDVIGWDFANNDANPTADDAPTYHGTHCAGTIGAVGNNGKGISGYSPNVSLMALKFLDSNKSGYTSNAVKAVDYAIAHGAKIISNSWGSFNYSQAMSDAVARARANGVLFTAAAGNSGNNNDSRPFYPANYQYDNVISVAATDSSDQLASFSDYGAQTVHIGAPGVNIYSTKNGGTYQNLNGTSMATPLVSGVLALMVAYRPELTYRQIRNALLTNVDRLSSLTRKVTSGGRINAYKAMSAIASSSIPDTSPSPSSPPPSTNPNPDPQTPCP